MAHGIGVCLRFPPNMQNPDRSLLQTDYFPRVDASDWCGEWMHNVSSEGRAEDMSAGHGVADE